MRRLLTKRKFLLPSENKFEIFRLRQQHWPLDSSRKNLSDISGHFNFHHNARFSAKMHIIMFLSPLFTPSGVVKFISFQLMARARRRVDFFSCCSGATFLCIIEV